MRPYASSASSARLAPPRPPAPPWLGLALLAAMASCGSAAEAPPEPPRPLALRGEAAGEAVHVLMAVAAGDADAIAEAPASLFHAPVAIPDEHDPDLARRWTLLLPRALARAPEATRAGVVARLDEKCRADLAHAPSAMRAALARDWLPAPRARAELDRAAALAFDRGRFADCLLATRALADDADPSGASARRAVVAMALRGAGADDAGEPLADPGAPAPAAGNAPPPDRRGAAVAWAVVPGHLLACDGDGRALWQHRIELGAEVVCGIGAALVRDADGLRAIDEDGATTRLAPPPGETRLLAVAAGAAWFATGTRAWRLPLAGGTPTPLELGAEPVGAPLARGARSLWLTRGALLLFDGPRRVATMRHQLGVGAGWRLAPGARHGDAPGLVAADGSWWRIEPLEGQLARADAVGAARLLVRAGRCEEALTRLGGDAGALATPAGRAVAFAAHAGLGPAHVAADVDRVAAFAADPASLAQVRLTAFRATADGAQRSHAHALVAHLRAHPDVLVGWDAGDIAEEADAWRHASSGAILADTVEMWLRGGSGLPDAPLKPLRADAEPAGAPRDADGALVDPQLGRVHRVRDGLLQLEHAPGSTVLSCVDAGTRRVRWRTRWDSDPTIPSRTLTVADGLACVAEGMTRLVAVDATTGTVRCFAVFPGMPVQPSRVRALSPTRLAMLGPLSDELALVDAARGDGFSPPEAETAAVRIALPARARWLAPLPPFASALVVLEDGRALLYPGARPAEIPRELIDGGEPTLTPLGLERDGRRWAWNRGD